MLLKEKVKGFNIILASGSARRKLLMRALGVEFEVVDKYGVDETYPETITVDEAAWYISKVKSESYPEELKENDLLITADTVVVLGGKIYGKPASREEAIDMLKSLSGRTHKVITGVTLRSKNHIKSFSDMTEVCFRVLKDDEIEYYVDNYSPFDKAGGYGVQEYIGCIGVSSISGSYFNVVGLPTEVLYRQLMLFVDKIVAEK